GRAAYDERNGPGHTCLCSARATSRTRSGCAGGSVCSERDALLPAHRQAHPFGRGAGIADRGGAGGSAGGADRLAEGSATRTLRRRDALPGERAGRAIPLLRRAATRLAPL